MLKNVLDSLRRSNSYIADNLSSPPKLTPISPTFLNPGDLVFLKYDRDLFFRVVLVVSNKKGSGVFLSSRGNLLVSCFQLNVSPEITSVILNKLYKNRVLASYRTITSGLRSLLGKDRYRTFKLNNIRELYTLKINGNS